ncbi:MAG: response regulator [Thiohalocapsa sp.]
MSIEASSISRFRVLIIEDSPTMRAVCAHSLGTAGIDCDVCGDGETGLALLIEASGNGRPFDGLLLDWLLPGMDGWEVLEKIAADHRLDRVSVMIFTDQPDDRAYRLASGRPNNDIQLKEDLTLLPYRMRKFLTTYSDVGSMGDWRGRQLLKNREQLGGSILFVDDSPTVCAKYGDLLRNNGYRVLIAKSMAEALDVARREKPDLALVDYFMPNGNGDELCRALLADDRTRDVTVVMHSQRKDVIEDALNAGAIDLIWKDDPVNIFLMRTASIMRTLRARRQAKDLDILFAATDALDVGLLSLSDGQWREFNETMGRFSSECGGTAPFIPDATGGNGSDARDLTPTTERPSDAGQLRRIVDRQGRRRAFNIHEVDVADADRVVLVQDVTAMADQAELLEQARDKAVELANAKSRFLANMSHEIRTPLNGVIGMLELLNGSELSEEQRHFADTGIASAEALLGLIGDVLDFSKIDAGRLELEQIAFKLPEMVEDIGQMLAAKAAEKGLEMICDVEPDVPLQVMGDAGRLRQVLINLLGNALKFTERGEVGLRLRLEHNLGDRATLSFAVTDTGIGIEHEAQQHIFEAFRQADDTTTRRFGGTGLGLAISGQLVELMGGNCCWTAAPAKAAASTSASTCRCAERTP